MVHFLFLSRSFLCLFFLLSDISEEHFNVIVFYVSDLGHKKKILGRTQVTATYGCPHCKKKEDDLEQRVPSGSFPDSTRHDQEWSAC